MTPRYPVSEPTVYRLSRGAGLEGNNSVIGKSIVVVGADGNYACATIRADGVRSYTTCIHSINIRVNWRIM